MDGSQIVGCILKKMIKKEPDNPYLYFQLGQSYNLLHDDENAALYYEKGLSFDSQGLSVSSNGVACFDKWYQCFAVFIKDGIINPFEYSCGVFILLRFKNI